MMTLAAVLGLSLLLLPLSAKLGRDFWIGGAIVALMLNISTFGSKVVMVGGAEVNSTSPTYAVVLLMMILCTRFYGIRYCRRSIYVVMMALAAFIGASYIIANANGVNAEVDEAYALIFDRSWRIAAGSFAAFWLSSYSATWIYRINAEAGVDWVLSVCMAFIIGQFIDSAIFFPIAFGTLETLPVMVRLSFFGALYKIAMSFIALPVVLLANSIHQREQSKLARSNG